jgi:polysaccharide deacetylase family protein (PEP-CTERM system associated)
MDAVITFDIEEPKHSNIGNFVYPKNSSFDESIGKLLALLKERKIHAVFFVVGETAIQYPLAVRSIADNGHEVAAHSMHHKLIIHITESEFRSDIKECKKILERITNKQITGYRAPSWSAHTKKTPWLWRILREEGYQYSSSVMPFKTFLYGDESIVPKLINVHIDDPWPFLVFGLDSIITGGVPEIVPSTILFAGWRIPFSGGFYFRMLPWWAIKYAVRKTQSPLFYFHLRDLGFESVPNNLDMKSRFIQYSRSRSGYRKFVKLLRSRLVMR